MPYLPPSVVLERLSGFTAETVVGAIGEDVGEESRFARAQAGSMSSTLGFLAREVAHRDGSILEQRAALLDALDALEPLGGAAVDAFVADQRDAVEAVEPTMGNTDAVDAAVLDALCALQTAVADGTFGADTPEARGVLYDLFETRLESQLRVLGRES